MNRVFALAIFFSLFASFAPQAMTQDGVAAAVNDAIITEQDVLGQSRLLAQQYSQKLPPQILRQRALTDLIEQQVKAQYGSRFTASSEEIDAAFRLLAAMNNMTSAQLEKASLGAESALYNKLKVQVLWDKVIRQEIMADIEITTQEIDRTLKDMAGDHLTDEVELGQIISRSSSETEKIQTFLNKGVSSKNFDIMAEKMGAGASSERKGYLGWLARESLAPDVQKALSDAKAGDVIGPMAMPDGHYQWLKIYRMKSSPHISFEPVEFVRLAHLKLSESAQKALSEIENWQSWPLVQWQEAEGVSVTEQDWQVASSRPKVSKQYVNSVPENLLEVGEGFILLERKQDMSPQLLKMRERVKEKLTDNRARMLERQLLRKIKSKAFIDIK